MKFLVIAALACSALPTYAQDTIYYVKSAPIIAKVEEINPGNVKYKLWDNQTGPSYVLPRKQISRIGSADGKMIWVNEKQWDKHNDEIKRTEERPVSAVPGITSRISCMCPLSWGLLRERVLAPGMRTSIRRVSLA